MSACSRLHKLLKCLALTTLLVGNSVAFAVRDFKTLHTFSVSEGSSPNEIVQGGDGYYYGTTVVGGAYSWHGTVYKMSKKGVTQVLYSFNGVDGSQPRGALVDGGDGYFYGVTSRGGTYGTGTAFKISSEGVITFLHSFGGTSIEGTAPQALTRGNDQYFYGVSLFGGTNSRGTIFKMSRTGTTTTLRSFSGSDGSSPSDRLLSTGDGYYYGITTNGGLHDRGVAFKVSSSGQFSLLYSFQQAGVLGHGPTGPLSLGADNLFYGTTQGGGTQGWGTVYKMSTTGGVTWLRSFQGGNEGGIPKGGVTLANNFYYYGTTSTGGSLTGGTTFKMSGSGQLTTLHSFNPSNGVEGSRPHVPLLLNVAGKMVGATEAESGGSVFIQRP
jgi:uncharacterized repeat protein (TIGR03803 family)